MTFLLRDIRLFRPMRREKPPRSVGAISYNGAGSAEEEEEEEEGETGEGGSQDPVAVRGRRRRKRKCSAAANLLDAPEVEAGADVPGLGRFCVPEEQITLHDPPAEMPRELREHDGDFGFGEDEDAIGTLFGGVLDDQPPRAELEEQPPPQSKSCLILQKKCICLFSKFVFPATGGHQLEQVEEEFNGTKQPPQDASSDGGANAGPGAPRRPRSPAERAEDAETPMPGEEQDSGGKRAKRRREMKPPPLPDMQDEEEEVEPPPPPPPSPPPAAARREEEEDLDPLPVMEAPPAGGRARRMGGKKKKPGPTVDREKELSRKQMQENLQSAQDTAFEDIPLPPSCFIRAVATRPKVAAPWLGEPLRPLGGNVLRKHFVSRMMAKMAVEEEEEVEDPGVRDVLREGSLATSSLMDETSLLRISTPARKGRRPSPEEAAAAGMEQTVDVDDLGLNTIQEEPMPPPPPTLDVSHTVVGEDGIPEQRRSSLPSSSTEMTPSSSGILSLASGDAMEPDRLDDLIGDLTSFGRRDTTFSKVAESLGGRRAVAVAFYSLLQLEADGKVQTRQEKPFKEIKIFHMLNR